MKEISVKELKEWQDNGADFQLIDVREPHEYDHGNMGGELIPLASVPSNIDKFARDKKVVVHCRSGARSANAIRFLEQKGYDNLYNLAGGIIAWGEEIDPSLPKF